MYITDASVQNCKHLRILRINENSGVTDNGIKGLKKLKTLCVKGNNCCLKY